MTGESSKLSRIRFLVLPKSAGPLLGGFDLDPSAPIPVELPLGADEVDLGSLTIEMILAGMLKVIAHDPGSPHSGAYRAFVLRARPGIEAELMTVGIQAADAENFEVADEVFRAVEALGSPELRATLNRAILAERRAEAYERIGDAALAERFWEEAFSLYKALLASDEAHPDSAFYAAFFFLKKRNLARARECFSRYAESGTDPEKLASAREALGRLGEAGELDGLMGAAYDAIAMGREEEGIARAEEFIARKPGVWNAWFLKGWAQRRLGRYSEGRESFLKARELGAADADLQNELAICCMELGLLPEARKELERALAIDADNVKIISNLGVLAMKGGKREEAAAFFRTALEIEPKDPVSVRYLAELEG